MMIALVGLNANAAMYIVGTNPFGNWDPSQGVEMTLQNDGTYTLDATLVQNDIWFIFAEAIGDWNTVNANRYDSGNPASDLTVYAGVEFTPVKGATDKSFFFSGTAGETYTFSFNPTTGKAMVAGYVEPFTPLTGKLFILGQVNGNNWNPATGIEMATTDENIFTLTDAEITNSGDGFGFFSFTSKLGEASDDWSFTSYRRGAQADGTLVEPGVSAVLADWGSTGAFKVLPGIYDIEVNLSNNTVTLTNNGAVEDYYIVAGTENLFGSNWNATDTLNLMTEGENGVFTWTKEGFEATANTEVQFKVVANSNWSTCWPQSDENGDNNWWYQFAEDGVYTVVITFNEETKEINLTATRTGDLPEPPQPAVDDVYIIGDVNNIGWVANDGVKMTYNEGIYTAEITTQNQGDLGIAYFGFTKQLADSANGWDDITAYRFGPMSNGAFVMTEELLNVNCELDLEGSYESIAIPEGTWTVTVDLANGLFKINGTWPTDTVTPQPETNVYIIGEVNDNGGWFTNKGVQMTLNEGIYTANITTAGENDGLSYFSFTKQLADSAADWEAIAPYRFGAVSEGNFIMTEELLGVECALTAGGEAIALPAGEWTVTVDLENNKFTINGEWPEIPVVHYDGDVYIMGEVNDNGGWFTNKGVKMTRDAENNLYTATITTAGENDGYSYFSFTKQLADSAADWDAIAPYRFGAVSEGDFLVTDELLGQNLSLEMGGDAFKIEAGKWNLTLSVDDMTLKIEKVAGLRGDVNDDEAVTIADVSALIDYLLTEDATGVNLGNADCNLDESVNIADVSALIDYLLTEAW